MGQAKQSKTEVEQLKMANKLLRTTPKKLQPFFWESDPYFTDFIEEGIDEKFKSVEMFTIPRNNEVLNLIYSLIFKILHTFCGSR